MNGLNYLKKCTKGTHRGGGKPPFSTSSGQNLHSLKIDNLSETGPNKTMATRFILVAANYNLMDADVNLGAIMVILVAVNLNIVDVRFIVVTVKLQPCGRNCVLLGQKLGFQKQASWVYSASLGRSTCILSPKTIEIDPKQLSKIFGPKCYSCKITILKIISVKTNL